MIKVVIADDIQILRQGLKAILEQDDEIEVAGLAADGRRRGSCAGSTDRTWCLWICACRNTMAAMGLPESRRTIRI